jgi:hypothetical protein
VKTKSNKAKGRTGQQEVRDALLAAFPTKLEADDIRSTSMGDTGSDLKLSPAAKKLIPISPEVKRRKAGLKTVYDWLTQAKSGGSMWPTVFFRQDRSPWLVVVELETFIELLKQRKI